MISLWTQKICTDTELGRTVRLCTIKKSDIHEFLHENLKNKILMLKFDTLKESKEKFEEIFSKEKH